MLNYQRVLEAQSIADVFESQRTSALHALHHISLKKSML